MARPPALAASVSAPAFASLARVLALCLIACAIFTSAAQAAEPVYPVLTGRVVDDANLLSAEDEAQMTVDLEALEAKSTDQLVVVTLASLQGFEIEEFGYRLGRHWAIGQKDKDNGVLLIVAPKERKVRIEVGRGLEPLLTDALSRLIIENAILPRFRKGDFTGGIKAGVRDITAVLTGDAEELRARAKRGSKGDEFDRYVAMFIVIIWFIIFFAVMWSIVQSIRHGTRSATPGKGGKKDSSGWTWGSGGSSGGGWSGGGGFSGGGGGFGGGGSSGGW